MATYIGDKMVSLGIHKATDKVVLSQAEYEALEKKDPDTLYLVYDDHTLDEINAHIDDEDVHVTAEEKAKWNAPQIDVNEIPNLHVWKHEYDDGNIEYLTSTDLNAYTDSVIGYKEPYWDLGEEINNIVLLSGSDCSSSSTYVTYIYSDSVEVGCDGDKVFIAQAGSMGVSTPSVSDMTITSFAGRYVRILIPYNTSSSFIYDTDFDQTVVYYIPNDATISKSSSKVTISKAYTVVGHFESFDERYTYLGCLGSGTSDNYMKKELIAQVAVDFNLTNTTKYIAVTLPIGELDRAMFLYYEFVGDVSHTINSTTTYYTALQFGETTSFSSSGSNVCWTISSASSNGNRLKKVYKNATLGTTHRIVSKSNQVIKGHSITSVPNYSVNYSTGTSTYDIDYDSTFYLLGYAQNNYTNLIAKGTFNVYAIKI